MSRTPTDTSVVVAGLDHDLPITVSATTSRVVVDNDAVRVVAFAFDAGEQLTEHRTPMPAVVQVLSGSLRFQVSGTDHELASGDCVYLASDEPHALEATSPCRMSLVMVRHPPASR